MLETPVVVKVHEGLHARPATQFAKLAKSFTCSLKIGRGDAWADAKSAVKLMLLGIKQNEQIVLRAEGEDECEALGRLAQFLADPSIASPAAGQAGVCVPGAAAEHESPTLNGAGAGAPAADARGLSFNGVAASEGLAF